MSRYQVPIERMMLGSCGDDSDEYEFDDGGDEGETDAVEIDAVWRVNLLSNVERLCDERCLARCVKK